MWVIYDGSDYKSFDWLGGTFPYYKLLLTELCGEIYILSLKELNKLEYIEQVLSDLRYLQYEM
jgi:hypothetical protein